MKRSVILLLLIASVASADWAVDGVTYTHRKKVTVPDASITANVAHALIFCPIIADTDIGGNTNSDGRDLKITKSDETTLVDGWKKQTWTVTGGSLTAIVWFSAPLTDGQANDFYLYYDSSSEISDSDSTSSIATACSLTGWWPFNETTGTTAYDWGSGGHNGTIYNATVGQTGVIGKCLSLDGTGDYVNLGAACIPANTYTLAMWSKSSATTTLMDWMGQWASAQEGRTIWCCGTTNKETAYVNGTQRGVSTASMGTDWVHVSMSLDGSGNNAFSKNGALDGSDSSVPNTYQGTNTLVGSYNGTNECFNGLMEHVKIFNRVVPETELLWMYTNQVSATGTLSWGSEETPGGSASIIPLLRQQRERSKQQ